MKFGFSKLASIALLGSIMMSGCSPTNRPVNKNQIKHQAIKSRHKMSHFKNANTNSRTNLIRNDIQLAVKNCLASASGQTAVYVASTKDSHPVIINNRAQRSASVIKLFIMITAFSEIKAGRLQLNQMVKIPQVDRVGGTGALGQQKPNQLTISQLLTLMIKNSDNTATNVLIDCLGGLQKINIKIKQLGCTYTKIQRKMLNYHALIKGQDNLTSVKDIGTVLGKLYQHNILGDPYDTEMLQLLRYNANQSKLPALINQKAIIYNKTGEFPDYGVQNDAAIVQKGKRAFIVVVLSQNGLAAKQIKAMQHLGQQLYTIVFTNYNKRK